MSQFERAERQGVNEHLKRTQRDRRHCAKQPNRMQKRWAAAGARFWQQKHSQIEYSTNSIYLKAKKQSRLRGTFSALHRELAMKVPLKIMGLFIATFNTFSERSQHISLSLGLKINCRAKYSTSFIPFQSSPLRCVFLWHGFSLLRLAQRRSRGWLMSTQTHEDVFAMPKMCMNMKHLCVS